MTLTAPDTGLRLTDWASIALAITAENQIGYAQAQTALGTNQATALVILPNQSIFELTTVASGTGVQLPVGSPGKRVTIANNGLNNLKVYTNALDPAATPKINTTTGSSGVTLNNGTNAMYVCPTAGQWYEIQGT